MSETVYRVGSVVVVDEDGRNLRVTKSHSPNDRVAIERADRRDFLRAIMLAEGVEDDVIAIAAHGSDGAVQISSGPVAERFTDDPDDQTMVMEERIVYIAAHRLAKHGVRVTTAKVDAHQFYGMARRLGAAITAVSRTVFGEIHLITAAGVVTVTIGDVPPDSFGNPRLVLE